MHQWKTFPFPAAPTLPVGFRCILGILNTVSQCVLETLHHGEHSALLWCSAAESRELKGRPPTPPEQITKGMCLSQDRALRVLRSVLTPAEDNCWQRFTSPLCLTAFLQFTIKSTGGFTGGPEYAPRSSVPGSLQLHTGFAQCLCCSETLPVPSAALQKAKQDQVLQAGEVSDLFLVQVFSMSCILLLVADCHRQTFSPIQAKCTPGSMGRELPLFL